MTDQQLEKLTDIFRTLFNNPDLILREGLVATDVPGWDSFNHVNLMITIEQEFGVKFTNEEDPPMQNLDDPPPPLAPPPAPFPVRVSFSFSFFFFLLFIILS